MISAGAANANVERMEPSPGLARFAEVVSRDDFPLDHAALLIGAWDYPDRDLEAYRDHLRRWAAHHKYLVSQSR